MDPIIQQKDKPKSKTSRERIKHGQKAHLQNH